MNKNQIYESLNQAYFAEEPHEKKTLECLPTILRQARVFIDVGASLGQYTYHANRHMLGCYILAIEPDPIRFDRLRDNCSEWESQSSNRIQALHAAISDLDGKTKFHITNSPASGGLFEHDLLHTVDGIRKLIKWQEISVDCFTLDTLCKNLAPDFIKIDVEGGELRVLRGSTRILEEGRAKFLIEIHGWVDPEGQKNANEVFNFMSSFGYYSTNLGGRHLFVKKALLEVIFIRCVVQAEKPIIWIAQRILPVSIQHWLRIHGFH